MTQYDDGGSAMFLMRDSSCPSLNRARNSSGELLSLWRARNRPLAGEFLTKCPVMIISLPLGVAMKS